MDDQQMNALVKKAIRGSKIRFIFLGSFLVGFWVFMMYLPKLDKTMGKGTEIGLLILGLVFLITGVLMLYVGLRSSRIMSSITSSPETLVWIYRQNVVTQTGTQTNTSNIVFHFSDGKKEVLSLGPKTADNLLDSLKMKLPKTNFGYNKELEKKFKENPNSL